MLITDGFAQTVHHLLFRLKNGSRQSKEKSHLQKVEATFLAWIRQHQYGQHWPLTQTALASHHGLAHASPPHTNVFIYKPKFVILCSRPTITNAASSLDANCGQWWWWWLEASNKGTRCDYNLAQLLHLVYIQIGCADNGSTFSCIYFLVSCAIPSSTTVRSPCVAHRYPFYCVYFVALEKTIVC